MDSESNTMNQPSEPSLCANGCGFFGSSSTMNLCSKCFNGFRIQQEQAKVAVENIINHPNQIKSRDVVVLETSRSGACKAPKVEEEVVAVSSNRCLCCNKKVGVLGFKCKCGNTFCGSHRYPEQHVCTFDFRGQGKEEIKKDNPLVKADKLGTRI